MLTVTEAAQTQVDEYFKDKTRQPVRIFVTQGCGGRQIAMAVDKIQDTDEVYTINNIEYIVDKAFLEEAKPIKVDFGTNGFSVSSSLELGSGCSSCGTSGECCS